MARSAPTWDGVMARLKEKFGGDLLEVSQRSGVLSILHVRPEAILRLATFLRDEGTFVHCALVDGVDWVGTMEVIYTLWSDGLKGYLEISLRIPSEDPHVDSVTGVWGGASWHEREAWDLLGIRFDGHPDLRRLLMPEGYKFHPLRKDFELREPEELEVKARHV